MEEPLAVDIEDLGETVEIRLPLSQGSPSARITKEQWKNLVTHEARRLAESE